MAKNHSSTQRSESTANSVSFRHLVSFSSLANITAIAIEFITTSSLLQLLASFFLPTSCVSTILDHSFTGDSEPI